MRLVGAASLELAVNSRAPGMRFVNRRERGEAKGTTSTLDTTNGSRLRSAQKIRASNAVNDFGDNEKGDKSHAKAQRRKGWKINRIPAIAALPQRLRVKGILCAFASWRDHLVICLWFRRVSGPRSLRHLRFKKAWSLNRCRLLLLARIFLSFPSVDLTH